MHHYDEGYQKNEPPVYSATHGFYNPYAVPEWKREKHRIQSSANGIAAAFLGYVLLAVFGGTLIYTFLAIFMPFKPGYEVLRETAGIISYVISFLLPFGAYMLAVKIPASVAFPFRKPKADLTVCAVFTAMGVGVAAAYAGAYFERALQVFGVGITMPDVPVPENPVALALYFVSMIVAPAFIEEMVFRGVIMQSLRRFGDIFALVTSALIFGIFHLNLVQMPYAFILGLCIGYFVMRSGSLWVGVAIHFVNNSVAAIFTVLEPHMTENAYILANLIYNLAAVLIAIAAVAALLSRYKDMFRFEHRPGILTPAKRAQYFAASPVMIIAAVVALLFTLKYVYII